MNKIVYIFGNPDLHDDSLPIRILPKLQKEFPDFTFEIKDPNEEWDAPEELVVLDTAIGIKDVTVFHDLSKFVPAPQVSMHDFDALANLRLLVKLGKVKKVTVIAIPMHQEEITTTEKVMQLLKENHLP